MIRSLPTTSAVAGALLLAAGWLAAGCLGGGGPPLGLRAADEGPGPQVVFDWDAKPLPEVPLPNDMATWPDPTSPTGLRVNVSLIAPTQLEAELRDKAQSVTGFGVYAPIWVSFDAPLDPGRIRTLHSDADWTNDTVYVVNVDPDSALFGTFSELDMGRGHMPLVLERPDRYFDGDPRAQGSNIVFETADEDVNGNGLLDAGEDTDGDGVLDRPNVWPPGGDPTADLLPHYELQTNTLIIRVVEPLDQRATHAVVLTKRLTGLDGRPVRSPFPYVNHVRQTEDLQPLAHVLSTHGQSLDDVAFAWSFTTQDVTGDLEALRAGLYGHGVYAHLKDKYPVRLDLLHEMVPENTREAVGNPYTLKLDDYADLIIEAAGDIAGIDPESADALLEGFAYVDHLVSGSFSSPDLLIDDDGLARPAAGWRADEDESWRLNPGAGELIEGRGEVTFICTVPKEIQGRTQPFPTAFIGHGYGSNRLEMLVFSGSLARLGFAGCALDAPGHGMPDLEPLEEGLIASIFGEGAMAALGEGRARDLDNDGDKDGGGDYWTADIFHTRDMVRQATLDYITLIRDFRSFKGGDHLTGDFDGNGRPDVGGPDAKLFMTGGSLGGILTAVVAGVEPALAAAAPIVGGGGLLDLGLRSLQKGVPEAAILRMFGPLAVLQGADEAGNRRLEFLVPRVADEAHLTFATLGANDWAGGDLLQVSVDHVTAGGAHERQAPIPADGRAMRVHFPADALDVSERQAALGLVPTTFADRERPERVEVPADVLLGDPVVVRVIDGVSGRVKREIRTFEQEVTWMGHTWTAGSPLVSPADGFGHTRGSPEVRRLAALAAMLLEPGDPIALAPHHWLRPLSFDYDTAMPGTNVLHVPTVGDLAVPVATGVALARAGGAITAEHHAKLVEREVVQGVERVGSYVDTVTGTPLLCDIDDLSDGQDGFNTDCRGDMDGVPLRAQVSVPSGGVSGLRLPYVETTGVHGFGPPRPDKAFDIDSYSINMIGRYFQTDGDEILDAPCLEDNTCEFIPPPLQ